MSELDNIKIVRGEPIPHHDNYRRNCVFNYIEFKNVETTNFQHNPESSDTAKDALKKLMRGKQSLLWVHSIGEVGGLNSSSQTIMSNVDAEKYTNLQCCFQTPYGSLVPQVIVPTRNVIDNGMEFPIGIGNEDESQLKKEGGYNWMPLKLNPDDYAGSLTLIDATISKPLTYGERVPLFKCVTNEFSSTRLLDHPIYTKRVYKCDTSEGAAGTGSCALCYKIVESNEIGDGATDEQKKIAPIIQVQLAGKSIGQSYSNEVNSIIATIEKSGQMIGQFGERVGQGSLSEPSNDLMPPQCRRTADGYDLSPLFMYPLYNGFVMTNSAIGNLTSGSNTIFIKYEDEPLNPIYTCRVNGVYKSQEIERMIDVDGNSELMQWFPPLFQECQNPLAIQLKVPRSEKIDFADNVTLSFNKCLGRFAYCPIYFQRRIKLTLFFKGEYQSMDTSNGLDKNYGEYLFYPLICTNIGENTSDAWSGVDSSGAECVSDVRHVVDDDNLQESIYAVDFYFESPRLERYPIEIFGAVAVYVRNDFQFKIENGNGDFVWNKDIFDMFTGFCAEQDKFPDNKYLALISNMSVSASLDGVSGSMSLDGYPLKQGIKVFKQDQSVGEADFSVMHKGVKHDLFSGYAMELSTSDAENNYGINVNLVGINKKLEDMKLICAPFWDGDRLEMVCAYFEEYANIKIKMIDHTVHSYDDAKTVHIDPYTNGEDNPRRWLSNARTMCNSTEIRNPVFRLPRSCDWRSPAVNFDTGTPVFDALKTLGQLTSCLCVPQLDGTVTFYEFNNYGYPYYVDNQTHIVEFDPTDIVSISMQPQLQNKYNSIATFGFLQHKNADGRILAENVQHGAFYSKTNGGNLPHVGVQFPWSKQSVGVEPAMYTKWELANVHANRVRMLTADIYLGNMTVRGNTRVNHMYQRIRACGQEYFVISIEHSLDLSSKVWTTSYQLQCINRETN